MIPWILTLSRLPLAGAFALAVAAAAPGPLGAGGLAILLSLAVSVELTDLLDGWAARHFHETTELGGLVDPLCDSLSRLTLFYAAALAGWVWIGVPLVMTARDIIVAYVRIVLTRTGARTSARLSGKLKAIVQGVAVLVVVVLAADGLPTWLAGHLTVWRASAAGAVIVVTGWSCLDYLRAALPAVRRMTVD